MENAPHYEFGSGADCPGREPCRFPWKELNLTGGANQDPFFISKNLNVEKIWTELRKRVS